MAPLVFPVSSAPGLKTQEGSGRLINCYAVKTEQGARSPILWKSSPGLREIHNISGHTHCRGLEFVGATLIHVLGERVYTITESAGAFTSVNRGALTGTDCVTIARNNASTPNIVAVTEDGTFNLFVDSAPTSFADGDLPAVVSCTGANGYLVFNTAAGVIWATDLNAVTVPSNSNESAQMPLRRVIFFRDELFAMGADGVKVYEETGDSPFPFRYKKINIPRGICGTHAVAGFENGSAKELVWVGEDNNVYRLDGYSPVNIANDDVSRAIAGSADRTLIECHAYTEGKNSFVVITSPGEWTWEFNLTTGAWNERESYGRGDWRGRRSVRAFDRWVIGDDETGKLAQIDADYRREYNDPLIWTLESGANASQPWRLTIPSAYFDFTAAVGVASGLDPIETDPVVMISWSFDGGYTWGNEVQRALGAQGQGDRQVKVNRVGTTKAKGIRFRLRISDPIHIGFCGGQIPDVSARAA